MTSGSKYKLLFLMSRDFGELTTAIYFITGQDFDTRFLVPPAMFAVNPDGLPAPAAPYQGLEDILAAVDHFQPDVFFLFSGYLHVDNELLSLEDLERLVQTLRERGCVVVTSDPFLGVLARADVHTFNWQPERSAPVAEAFARVYEVLKSLPHLYLVDDGADASTEAFTFANPDFFQAPPLGPAPEGIGPALGLDPARACWLFVLAAADYELLTEDDTQFDDLLTDQLHEALHQGKQPVLIAPPACALAVGRRCVGETQVLGLILSTPGRQPDADLPPESLAELTRAVYQQTGGLVLLPLCRHAWFLSLILEAEYAFYWNLFSISVLIRTMKRRPSFFFDRGHMARHSTPLFQRGLQCYYLNEEPSYLAMDEPIEADRLAQGAAAQAGAVQARADKLLRGPAPATVVRQLLGRASRELPGESA